MAIIRKCSLLICCLLLINCTNTLKSTHAEENINFQKSFELKKENEELKSTVERLKERLKRLEPAKPEDIADPPWGEPDFPANVLPISDVIKTGSKIPFQIIINKPDYRRPAYEEHWYSTIGRWSNVPMRVHYALHRLFTQYDIGASGWYDFEHNLGLTVPMFQNPQALDMYIVTFQTRVISVYTKGNQVVVVGNPDRTGVQVITIKTRDIKPYHKNEQILVQLSTPNGSELDYSLISYVEPDFWSNTKKKLNNRLNR